MEWTVHRSWGVTKCVLEAVILSLALEGTILVEVLVEPVHACMEECMTGIAQA